MRNFALHDNNNTGEFEECAAWRDAALETSLTVAKYVPSDVLLPVPKTTGEIKARGEAATITVNVKAADMKGAEEKTAEVDVAHVTIGDSDESPSWRDAVPVEMLLSAVNDVPSGEIL